MSWEDHGPGTMEWDYMFGGNESGLYPDEVRYLINLEAESLTQLTFTFAGGGTWNYSETGSWAIDMDSVKGSLPRSLEFKVVGDDTKYKAKPCTDYKIDEDGTLVNVVSVE